MTTNQPRSFGRRLWWVIRTTLLIIIFVAALAAVLGGLGYAGYLGVQEIQRSNNSLMMRIEANEQNLNSLRELVNTKFAEGDPEQQVQINQLENDLASLTRQLEALQTTQAEDKAVQTEQMQTLEANLAAAVAQNSDLASELETVQAALVALQSDLNSSGVRIDELGGDVDNLRMSLGDLDDTLTVLTTEMTAARDSETAELQQSLTLLQLWGVLTNARLALGDNDVDSAETAVAQAITLADSLSVEPESAEAEVLTRLQTRLSLATDGFATDLPMVFQDLQAASRDLALLIIGPAPEAELVEATVAPTETAVTPTDAPTETATPSPSETPPPAPAPTATP
jgi:chromosome segregation ATPase